MISLAAGWLCAVSGIQAQTPTPTYEITWPSPETPPAAGASRLKTVTFTRPPAAQIQDGVDAFLQRQIGERGARASEGEIDFTISTGLPSLDKMTDRRESESQFNERLRQEYFARPGAPRIAFPERVAVSREKYVPRAFPQMVETIEPGFVMHRRLYFEQPNFDRHGWELGLLQPAISAGGFLADIVTLPYHACTRPFEHWDSSAGKLRPGDEPPLLWYRNPVSGAGLLGQAAAVAGFILVFP